MNLREFLVEGNQEITERPMGFIKQGLTKLGAKFLPGSFGAKMQGKLDTGTVANTLYRDFATYLGKTGQKATDDSVRAFLRSKGADKEIDIEKIIGANMSETVALSRSALNKIFMQVAQGLAGSTAHSLSASPSTTTAAAPVATSTPSAAPGTVPSAQPGVPVAQPAGTQPGGMPTPATKTTKKPTAAKKVAKPTAPVQQPTTPQVSPASSGGFKRDIPKQTIPQVNPASSGGFKRDIPKQAPAPTAEPAKPVKTLSNTPAAIRSRNRRLKAKAATTQQPTAVSNTSGKAKANLAQMPFPGQQLPSYTESILKKITVASISGVPVTRELYNAANKLMIENNTTLRNIGIAVDLKESTRHTVKLKKV